MTLVFLDRDGVVIKDVNNLTKPEQIELLPGAAEGIRLLNDARIYVIIITNQPVIARGWVIKVEVEKIHKILENKLNEQGAKIDKFYYCPHHPNATVEKYKKVCNCRKPEPGMLLKGAKDFGVSIGESYMVGDSPSDIFAGKKAGCKANILILGGDNTPIVSGTVSQREMENVKPDYTCQDLYKAAQKILELDVK